MFIILFVDVLIVFTI